MQPAPLSARIAPFPSSLRIFDMSDRDQLFSAPIAKLGDWT
ncbi:MAG: carboxy-S-adenosyl-L-methionine synthase CmoA, partial [Pantoea agglomerans]